MIEGASVFREFRPHVIYGPMMFGTDFLKKKYDENFLNIVYAFILDLRFESEGFKRLIDFSY